MPLIACFIHHLRLTAIVTALLLACGLTQPSAAQEFRIDTEIYVGDQAQATSTNTTLFSDGLVYDIPTTGSSMHEACVLEPARRRIVLLDRSRQVKLELDDLQLIRMGDSLRKQTQQNKAAEFLVRDRFEEQVDVASGVATLTSPLITYRVTGSRPSDVRMLPAHNQFLSYFTRMKFSDPHAFPPFPRLQLNETISKAGWIPSEVTIKIEKNPLYPEGMSARSRHTLTPTLSDRDRQTIADLKAQWLNYQSVNLEKYRALGQRTATNEDLPDNPQ